MRARTAVQAIGLKMLLLSACLAAFGAALPEPAQAITQASVDVVWFDVKLRHLVMGSMGIGAGLFLVAQLSASLLGFAVFGGLIGAAVGTPVVMLFVQVPGPAENGIAVLMGLLGPFLIRGIQKIGEKFSDDPWAVIDKVKAMLDAWRGPKPPGGGP